MNGKKKAPHRLCHLVVLLVCGEMNGKKESTLESVSFSCVGRVKK